MKQGCWCLSYVTHGRSRFYCRRLRGHKVDHSYVVQYAVHKKVKS